MNNPADNGNVSLLQPRKIISRFFVGLAILLLMQSIFVASNTVANMLLRQNIALHLDQSANNPLFVNVGNHEQQIIGASLSFDNNSFIRGIALQDDMGDPFMTMVMAGLPLEHNAAQGTDETSYFRYWHGWQLLTNLCLELGTLNLLQIVVFCLTIAATLLFFVAFSKYVGLLNSAIFLLVTLFTTGIFWNFLGDILLSISFFAALALSALILTLGHVLSRNKQYSLKLACMITGGVFCFLDFLTIPASVMALTVFCALFASGEPGESISTILKKFAWFCFAFLIGFCFTWAFKWVLTMMVTDPNFVINNLSNEMKYWTVTGEDKLGDGHVLWLFENAPRLYPIIASLGALILNNPAGCIGLLATTVLFVVAVILTIKAKRTASQNDIQTIRRSSKQDLLMCLPIVLVFLYMIIMNMHASCHTTVFTYKNWSIVMAIICCMSIFASQNLLRILRKKK